MNVGHNRSWLGMVRVDKEEVEFINYSKRPFDHILKVSGQYAYFDLLIKVCYNWVTMVIICPEYVR